MKKIYKIILILILNSAFSIHNSFSQQITFQKIYRGIYGDDYGHSVKQTADGGYIIFGDYNHDFNTGNEGAFLIKTNAYGDTLWTKVYGMSDYYEGNCVQQTADGGYIVTGCNDPTGYSDVILIKTNANGDTLWTKSYGGTSNDVGNSVRQTTDGGYIVAGWTASFGSGNADVYLIKTDSVGDTLWTKSYGGVGNDIGYSVQQTSDSGYIVAGITGGISTNSHDVYLIKTNSFGDTLWTKVYGDSLDDEVYCVQQTTDGGFILAGGSNSFGTGSYAVYLIKTDINGDTLWSKTYGGTIADEGYCVQQTADGGYIIIGTTVSFSVSYDIYLIKTDAGGNVIWSKTYGGANYDYGFSVQQTADGGYILLGSSGNFYLIKTDSLGNSGCYEGSASTIVTIPATIIKSPVTNVTTPASVVSTPVTIIRSGGVINPLCLNVGISNLQSSINNLQFSPNPFTTQSKLTFKNPNKENFLFTLYDITGRVTESVSTTANEIILTKGSKPAGVYLFNIKNEKTGERWNGKVVIQ